MSQSKKIQDTKKAPAGASARDTQTTEADVLYQRIGNQWYSYCVIDDEVFIGKVPNEALSPDITGETKSKK